MREPSSSDIELRDFIELEHPRDRSPCAAEAATASEPRLLPQGMYPVVMADRIHIVKIKTSFVGR